MSNVEAKFKREMQNVANNIAEYIHRYSVAQEWNKYMKEMWERNDNTLTFAGSYGSKLSGVTYILELSCADVPART